MQFLFALLGSLHADLRLSARAKTLRQLLADLNRGRCLAHLQCLTVRIYPDKLYAFDVAVNHAVHSVVACAADSDHNDLGCVFRFIYLNL